MKIQKHVILLVLTLSFVSFIGKAQEVETRNLNKDDFRKSKNVIFPKPIGFVNDFADLFTEEQEKKLVKFLTGYEKTTTNEIAIITITSIAPYSDFNQFAFDLSNSWGVGKKDKNNGLTIIISKSLQKIRISTGKGTERVLSDNFCKNVIDQFMVPEFRKGNYYDGLVLALGELIKQWK